MPFVCHTTMQQHFNHNHNKNLTKKKKGEREKLFLNLMHCSQYTSQFFSTGKGHYFTDTVALFGKKQKLNHMISVTTINKNQCERSQRKWINEAQSFSWELWKSSGPDMIGSSIKILALSQKLGICCHRWPRWRIDHLTIVMCYLSLLRFLEMAKKNQQCIVPLKWEIRGESDKMLFDFIFWVG